MEPIQTKAEVVSSDILRPCRAISGSSWWSKANTLIKTVLHPVSEEKRQLINERWNRLPETLRTDNQVIGKHWVHCGYTMGPSYCSFGCSHCYLPQGANRMPLVTLEVMKQQILAQRKLLGPGGNLQITGGDVIDAYWRAGKPGELVEVLRYATQNGLVPMLMTHGQILLEQPAYLETLVTEGGLRKLSIHIDITMAGRPGYPVRTLVREHQLNTLRDRFTSLILQTRKHTGKLLVAAQTVTVTSKNIDSIGDILHWLMSRKENMEVCRTISFQTEAQVGRTRFSHPAVTPEQVWEKISQSVGQDLVRDHLLFGHPDCSSVATVLARPKDGKTVYLASSNRAGRRFWSGLLDTFGGIDAKSVSPGIAMAQKVAALSRKPALFGRTIAYAWSLLTQKNISPGFIGSLLSGRAKGFNIVMHNFMSQHDIQGPRCQVTRDRLDACAFRGVMKVNGEWQAVSMCEMNSEIRPGLYKQNLPS